MEDRTCAAPGCSDERWGRKDYCRKHQERLNRNGTLERKKSGPKPRERACSVAGCDNPHKGYGYCRLHLNRERLAGRLAEHTTACAYAECGKPVASQGLCQGHLKQMRKGQELRPLRGRQSRDGVCPGPECDEPIRSNGHCGGHAWQIANGRPLTPIDRTPNVPKGTPCWVEDCGRPSLTKDGICRTHYRYRFEGGEDWRRPIPDRAPDGEGHLNAEGYRMLCIDGRMIAEHRLVMEAMIGRPLLPSETVHHKTGGFKGRSDNRPENLELWTSAHPKGHRVEDVVAYAREMLGLYGTPGERAAYADPAG